MGTQIAKPATGLSMPAKVAPGPTPEANQAVGKELGMPAAFRGHFAGYEEVLHEEPVKQVFDEGLALKRKYETGDESSKAMYKVVTLPDPQK